MTKPINCSYSIDGKGPPLFLIHGIGASRDAWRFVLPNLVKKFTVITYDLRGHGSSPKYQYVFDLEDLVEDLELLRHTTGFKTAFFAGHSLGGMIAPAYAFKYPNHVRAIGLLSTAAGRTQEDKNKIFTVIKLMEEEGISQTLPTLVTRWFTDDFIIKFPKIIEKRIQQVKDTDPDIFLNVFRIYANTEMQSWLHKISSPALVLTGENDGACNPRLNKLIANKLQNSELTILPDLKHSILIESPNLVSKILSNFFLRYS
ncbi:alpha/beta hydrolase [Alphaproteobacteria bacterium]|nr:alpha/beta hydrolase [Alphaproteobacteria bacterium]